MQAQGRADCRDRLGGARRDLGRLRGSARGSWLAAWAETSWTPSCPGRTGEWARAATQARNLLVHWFEGDPVAPLDGAAMFTIAAMTTGVITLILLQELGLPHARLVV